MQLLFTNFLCAPLKYILKKWLSVGVHSPSIGSGFYLTSCSFGFLSFVLLWKYSPELFFFRKNVKASAICQYSISDIQWAFEGPYMESKEDSISKWTEYTGKVPEPRPGSVRPAVAIQDYSYTDPLFCLTLAWLSPSLKLCLPADSDGEAQASTSQVELLQFSNRCARHR